MISLYIGGARSGKSTLAETDISHWQRPINYIATATNSNSMQSRIALHRQQRPQTWITHEVPLHLSQMLVEIDNQDRVIIVDCLTLWLTNQLMARACLKTQIASLCQTVSQLQSHVVLVSTEVGQGLIPLDDISQQFVGASGEMHQAIAAIADQVFFCQSGFATCLKNTSTSVDFAP